MIRLLWACAAFSGLLAVVLGAFAAHGLKGRLAPEMLAAFQTGVQYQMVHTLALLAVLLLLFRTDSAWLLAAAAAFLLGIACFSGSLYMLAVTGVKWFGPVTPLGGLLLIAGWAALLVAVLRDVPMP